MKLLGTYKPFFSSISLKDVENLSDAEDLLNILNNEEQLLVVFFHEYTHYLQNYGTTSGINENRVKCYRLKKIKELEQITLPLERKDIDNNNILLYYDISFGEIKEFKKIEDIKLDCDENCQIYICKIIQSQNNDFLFGSVHIHESMAILVEELVLNKPASKDELPKNPYFIVEYVVQREFPKLWENKLLVFALCEFCLNFSYSNGYYFVKLLREMKNSSQNFQTVDDIIQFCEGYTKFDKNIYFENQELIKNHTKSILQGFTEFEDYIEETYNRFYSVKQENFYFITKWIENYLDMKGNLDKYDLVNKCGFPILQIESSGDLVDFATPKKSETLKALLPFNDIFNYLNNYNQNNQTYPCSLYSICTMSTKNDSYLTSPFNRAIYHECFEDCPYTLVWKKLSLKDKIK